MPLDRFPFHDLASRGSELAAALERDGAALVTGCLPEPELARWRGLVDDLPPRGVRRSGRAATYASRGLLEHDPFRALVARWPLGVLPALATRVADGWRCVRGLLFDKSPESNWKVPWHQDLAVALAERREVPGFGPWSVKDGVVHAHAPAAILENCLALRLHLDASTAASGALHVLPGSHLRGVLARDTALRRVAAGPSVIASADAGDVLLMRPLVLHRSLPAAAPTRRRTLHFECCCVPLPDALDWAMSCPVGEG